MEACGEDGVESLSRSEALCFLEGVEGAVGGVSRAWSGIKLYRPSFDRKSEIPQDVLMPAPVMTMIL